MFSCGQFREAIMNLKGQIHVWNITTLLVYQTYDQFIPNYSLFQDLSRRVKLPKLEMVGKLIIKLHSLNFTALKLDSVSYLT